MTLVYCNANALVNHQGVPWRLTVGEAWDDADPIVTANPGLFDVEARVRRSTERPIEQATNRPGEKRSGKLRD